MNEVKSDPVPSAFVLVSFQRTVPVYSITEQEAKSIDQQQLYGSGAIAFGTLFCGMFINMLLCASPINWYFAAVLVAVWLVAWLLGALMLWHRRGLLSTVRQQSAPTTS